MSPIIKTFYRISNNILLDDGSCPHASMPRVKDGYPGVQRNPYTPAYAAFANDGLFLLTLTLDR